METSKPDTAAPHAAADVAARGSQGHDTTHSGPLGLLALAALGVVYGDIGTSPLYAMRESFHGTHAIASNPINIFGVLSLVFWSLIIVITLKYITFIMRADNRGEGGIMALTALATPIRPLLPSKQRWLVLFGVFGAALLYGDGVITPAISVLSAVEGLGIATPVFEPYILPITLVIITGLFLIQRSGTAKIGTLFGPVMTLWFTVLALLGIINIVQNPTVLQAVNPLYAWTMFRVDGWQGFLVLGTVFLAVTGGEALYADMGHFGRKPIQLAWFVLVLPALLLNYFGQGALLLREPEASHPFYMMAPAWAQLPLVILATCATIIASQALISGAFSITMQAQNLGFLPRLKIVHTSPTAFGQIYIPFVNWALMISCILVVLGFRTSSNLAAAYGIAVTSTMAITTLIFAVVARKHWHWNWWLLGSVIGLFLIVDLAFLAANLVKIPQGGWFPLVLAVVIFTFMTTWKRGNRLVFAREQDLELRLEDMFKQMRSKPVTRVPGTAIFLSANPQGAPAALLANLKYNQVVHERVLLTSVVIEDIPAIDDAERVRIKLLDLGFYRVVVRFGFMEEPNIPRALEHLEDSEHHINISNAPYFVNHTRVIPSKLPGMALWRERLYTLMRRNSASAVDFFALPSTRVFEIGTSVEV
ncbi:MAG: potassium transporter Kup [Roseiflexaceae bacterium]|nr:potassium transporter Kup [Roseiflexaceae bacterium]